MSMMSPGVSFGVCKILLIGVSYYIYAIMNLDFAEMDDERQVNQKMESGSGDSTLKHRIEDVEKP